MSILPAFPLCVHMCHIYFWCLWRPEEGIRCSGTRATRWLWAAMRVLVPWGGSRYPELMSHLCSTSCDRNMLILRNHNPHFVIRADEWKKEGLECWVGRNGELRLNRLFFEALAPRFWSCVHLLVTYWPEHFEFWTQLSSARRRQFGCLFQSWDFTRKQIE